MMGLRWGWEKHYKYNVKYNAYTIRLLELTMVQDYLRDRILRLVDKKWDL